MSKKKPVRKKGKINLSEYFKKVENGDNVCIVPEMSVRASFPKRIRGLTGKAIGSRGLFKIVELKDKNKVKKFIIHPVHLKKI